MLNGFFLKAVHVKVLTTKIWPYDGPGISDTCHILVTDNCISYHLPFQDSSTSVNPALIYTDFLYAAVTAGPVLSLCIWENSSGLIHRPWPPRGCDLLHTPALCPSCRGLSQIMKPSASSSFILLDIHLQSSHCGPDTVRSTYQYESFISSNKPPHKRGAARISVLYVRNQNHGEVEYHAQGYTRTTW